MATRKIFLALFVFVISFKIILAQQYTYTVDLQNIMKDRVKVTCTVPSQTADRIDFIFPNVIPGSYALKEYGRYIDQFNAFDENGNKLKVKKADRYNFSILGASKLKKIEYVVNDSWEEKNGSRFIFQPGGTNIDAGKNFVINNYGFFGYVEGMKNLPFNITVLKPTQLKGYSYLKINPGNETTDVITADNYDKLVDSPIMYCPPQDATFKIGDTEIIICVYSENQKVSAAQISEIVKPIAVSLQHFFGTLPVDRYLFMFYLADASKTPKRKGKGLGSGFGALEHNHCSFYYMPESSNAEFMRRNLSDVCAHEFLHILTPLNVHSKEIDDFNFRTPVMSQHLWMYEGVTEYFSNLTQLQDSLITMAAFMDEMRSKIIASSQFDIFSMTGMSKNVVTKENQVRYLSVYSRGAVLAMMLDILIINDSNGKNSLRQVMMELKKKYGPSKPFNDDDLIPEITAMTSPVIGDFFKNYIIGTETPPYQDYFSLIGYSYSPVFVKSIYYFGRFGANYDEDKKQFFFNKIEGENAFGIQNNDVIVSIDNKSVTVENIQDTFVKYFFHNSTIPNLVVVVQRDGKRLTLTGSPQNGTRRIQHHITVATNIDSKSTTNLNTFIGKVK
jgi:predicted metalloprotease with PDZ domain